MGEETLGRAVLALSTDDSGLDKGLKDAEGKSNSWVGRVGGALGKGLVVGAGVAIAAGAALTAALAGTVKGAMEAENVQVDLANVLRSTGGASGMTLKGLNDMAAGLQAVTPYEDDVILKGQGMLLTFTNIGKDVFPLATEAMLNLSTKMGTDLQGSAIQLGKALNDPIKGVTALTKAGVTFTQKQKDQIKILQESGNMVGAQTVILNEMKTEFDGVARAAGTTFSGKMAILNNQINGVKDSIGLALIPVLSGLAKKYGPDVIRIVQGIGDWMTTSLIPAISATADWLGVVIGKIIGFGNTLSGVFSGDLTALGDFSLMITDTFTSLGQMFGMTEDQALTFGMGVSNAFDTVRLAIPTLLANIQDLASLIPAVFQDLVSGDLGVAMDDIRETVYRVFGPDMAAAVQTLMSTIAGGLPQIVTQLKLWGQAFVAWIGPMIPPALAKLGELAGQLWAWVSAQAAPLLVKLGEWGQSFVAWIGPAATDFLARWPVILSQFLNWVGAAAGPLLLKLGDWAVSFVGWIIPMIPGFLMTLAKIAAAILIFVGETLLVLVPKIKEWGDAFINWVQTTVIPQLRPKLQAILLEMGAWVGGTALPWIGQEAQKLGERMVSALKQGISNTIGGAFDGLIGGIRNALNTVVGTINDTIRRFNSIPVAPDMRLIPGFATGTSYAPGGFARVGENGPEVVALPRGSQVYPNGQGPAMGGGITINQTFAFGTPDATRQAAYSGAMSALDAARARGLR